jgi:hypothetical protein
MTRPHYAARRLLPGLKHIHNITHFPKPLGNASGHCRTHMSLPGTKRRFVAAQDLRQLSVLSGHAAGSFLLSQALMLITSGKPSISAADFKD